MELIFATQNGHKRLEMALLCLPHTIVMPSELGLSFSFEETEETFTGNALGKAEHLYSLISQRSECQNGKIRSRREEATPPDSEDRHRLVIPATIADDSGIVIDALNGAPGIYSARYGADIHGRELSAPEKNQLVLEQLKGVEHHKRSARFVCALALVLSPDRKFIVQETVEGYIAKEPYGEGGFGYDPIFLVGESGRTMAEHTEQEKNSISHRALAAQRILAIIQQIEKTEVMHVS